MEIETMVTQAHKKSKSNETERDIHVYKGKTWKKRSNKAEYLKDFSLETHHNFMYV